MTSMTMHPMQQARTGTEGLAEQIRQDVQRAMQEAQQAQRAAQQAQRDAQAAGGDGVRGAFRVTEDGRLVPIGPDEALPGVAVTVQPDPVVFTPQVPPEAVTISIAFFAMIALIVIGWPLARAFARRMDRRQAPAPPMLEEQRERLTRIEQAVDAMAIEVERISEGQRFVTKLLTERALPEGRLGELEPARRGDALPVGGERR